MPQLKNGNELCDTCGKPYIALPGGKPCLCEIDATHTDPIQIETAAVLKAKQELREVKEALAEAEFIIDKFSGWYSDTGCPNSECDFCPHLDELKAEYDEATKDEAVEDKYPFCASDDCEYQMTAGGCYAEYYRKQYRDKKTKGELK